MKLMNVQSVSRCVNQTDRTDDSYSVVINMKKNHDIS